MASRRLVSLFFVVVIVTSVSGGPNDWLHFGKTVARCSVAVDGPNIIDSSTLAWVADEDPQDPEYFIEFEGATGPVVYDGMVYIYAKYFEPNEEAPTGFDYTKSQVVAYDANSGEMEWTTPIEIAIWDSWSSPSIDIKHDTVLIGSGYKVYALDAQTGTEQWSTQLEKFMVNASVCPATDIVHSRAFITDYDGFGTTGKLYCINLDANEVGNRYEPGEIVWSETIGGTSGDSPSYKDGVVYVGTISGVSSGYGTIYAYDATATTATKIWEKSDPNFDGFCGGLNVTKEGYIYAANYDWDEDGEDNSILCKIDCSDGNVVWITDVERTDSMPVVAGDKIYVSGGFTYDGSRPKVEAYQDLGNSAIKLWETPSNMVVGGWTNQPVYANGKLYVGAIPLDGNYFGSYTELYILDVTLTPSDANFVIDHYDTKECGSNPAVTYDSIYTMGYDGLFKFHQPALLGDVDKDNKIDTYDLYELSDAWLYDGDIGVNRCDLDVDGDVDFIDFCLLANQWREELD
ncbi:MAG: PQQ-binding-like beta-propeller repeat protein [Planctomycetes bacterium]|nr:PQQ-binding-like beta-propeller repeat protein [Planctomycetota bacterium]